MIIKQDEFEAHCINNEYQDWGNHTGFQWVTRKYDLKIGEIYKFEREGDFFNIFRNGKTGIGEGWWFSVNNMVQGRDFYHFFSTVSANREMKLNQLGI
jgi:hypothetical protein